MHRCLTIYVASSPRDGYAGAALALADAIEEIADEDDANGEPDPARREFIARLRSLAGD